MHLQAFVNCDVPGMRGLTYNTGGSPTALSITGYHAFYDYLDALSTALQAAGIDYVFEYDPSLDRVTASKQSGSDAGFTVANQSMRLLLGLSSSTQWATPASYHEGARAPFGIVPVKGARLASSSSARQITKREYTPRRARNVAFGSGTRHTVTMQLTSDAATRVFGGPCSAGRIRIGEFTETNRMSRATPNGYVEGDIISAEKTRTTQPVELAVDWTVTIHHAVKQATPADWDAVWGSMLRGYSPIVYARVEGIAHTFTEQTLGITASTHSESPTLVFGEGSRIQWSIDRAAGTTGCSSLRLGILDPTNELALFSGAGAAANLTAALAYNATTATVDDTSAFASSGSAYIGKERFTYSGKTSTTLTGMTRSTWGPRYAYDPTAPYSWRTVTQYPSVWAGRLVELWVTLQDPFGNAVASAFDDAHCRMIWAGEITTRPAYESGVWVLDCDAITQRLERPVGVEAASETDPYGALMGQPMGPVVILDETSVFDWSFEHSGSVTSGSTALSAIPIWEPDTTISGQVVVPWLQLVQDLTAFAKSEYIAGTGTLGDKLEIQGLRCERLEDGTWQTVFMSQQTGNTPGDGIWRLGPIRTPTGLAYCWNRQVKIEADEMQTENPPSGLKLWTYTAATGLRGQSAGALVVRAAGDQVPFTGEWPSPGILVAKGSDGDEVIEYAGSHGDEGRTYIYGLTRGENASAPADVLTPGVQIETYLVFTGGVGEQVASLLESSGTGDRGTYDTEAIGYGLPSSLVDESSLSLVGSLVSSEVAVASSDSAADVFGQALALLGYCLAPIRGSDRRLRIGARQMDPWGLAHVALTDADLRTDSVPQVSEQNPAPNVVIIEPVTLGGDTPQTVTIAVQPSVLAEGARQQTYAVPHFLSAFVRALLTSMAQQAIASRLELVAYRVHVSPARDWLPGQIVDVDVTHPGLWDYQDGAPGLTGRATILEVTRTLSGACELTLISRGDTLTVAPLCPVAKITAISGNDLTVDATEYPGGVALWEVGADVIVYQSGVSGSYTTVEITAVSGSTVTLATVPGWLDSTAIADGACFLTYPADDAAGITTQQLAHTHAGDGTSWL